MKAFLCTCCGSTVTAPYFFNGGVYGYTCIKKVNPSAKKIVDNGLWLQVDDIYTDLDKDGRPVMIAKFKDYTFRSPMYNINQTSTSYMQLHAKLLKVADFKNGFKSIWRNFDVITRRDSNHKLQPDYIQVIKNREFINLYEF